MMAAPLDATTQPQPQQHQAMLMTPHDVVASHLYHVGFVQGLHSDVLVRIAFAAPPPPPDAAAAAAAAAEDAAPETVFKLHKLLAVRSPFLGALIADAEMRSEGYGHPVELVLPIADPNINHEGLSIAFGSLYADYAHQILTQSIQQQGTTQEQRSRLLKGVLSASCLLHLPNLASLAADLIKADINRTTLADYCSFVSQHTESIAKDATVGANGSTAVAPSASPSSTWVLEIRDAIFAFLCKGIVREICERRASLIWGNKGSDAYKELVQAFSDLPFEWLKKVVEGKDFEVPNDMERFAFAKEVVAVRAKKQRSTKSNLVTGEENVLLAFGGGKAGAFWSHDCSQSSKASDDASSTAATTIYAKATAAISTTAAAIPPAAATAAAAFALQCDGSIHGHPSATTGATIVPPKYGCSGIQWYGPSRTSRMESRKLKKFAPMFILNSENQHLLSNDE
ncbi:hypothetical protein BDR26DRAFT_152802 [Obelidium mucronatum]|nr:hypothetical protein BDR26DRAFT_152802 [Obelidium mucronatum]